MQRQLGFNLIEVMVALVVLSLGILGMASLQLTSIQQNQDSYLRSQATMLAYDLSDRIRVNSNSRDNYLAVAAGLANANCMSYAGDSNGCSSANMAQHDLFEWYATLGRELPNGGGRVCRSDLQGDVVNPNPNPDCEANNSNEPVVIYVWWAQKDGSFTMMNVSTEM